MARSSTRCPVCGVVIAPCLIPSDSGVSFPCTRCRTPLELVASDPLPILAASVALSVVVCFTLELQGLTLVVTAIVATAVFYWLGKFLRSLLATPKLQRSASRGKLLHVAKSVHSSH